MRITFLTSLLVSGITFLCTITTWGQDPDEQREFMELRSQFTNQAGERDYEEAIKTVTKMMELAEDDQGGYRVRGELNYMAGNMAEAVTDFDKVIELNPGLKPGLWQRGLALYYLERYEDGIEQFEVHQTVNGQDVENAVWHFACRAKSSSLEEAREQLIPIQNDTRVPMRQIHQLYAGTMKPEEVIAAAEAGSPDQRKLAQNKYYAYLYIGLYFDASGESEKAAEYMDLAAAEDHQMSKRTLMGQVANVHIKLRSPQKTREKE